MRTIYWPEYAIDKKEQVVIYNNIQPQFDTLVEMGYRLWKGGHVTANGKLLLIYAKEKLIVR